MLASYRLIPNTAHRMRQHYDSIWKNMASFFTLSYDVSAALDVIIARVRMHMCSHMLLFIRVYCA